MPPKLDRIDIAILATLQRSGRMANVDLAAAVGLSPSPCLTRVKRLEAAGYIEGYRAEIAWTKLAAHIIVFTEVTLSDHRREDFIRFEAEIRRVEAVTECHVVSGGYDYLLKFVARNVAHYQDIIEGLLDRNVGIEKYFSYVVIKTVIVRPGVPVGLLIPE
ncbi:Lrp/AsnC family transcriptional regulator [Acuticoccus kandeliae]|uniref:Lrp/AsnC family transcriptional regulator n=1 Tax=Acuticoccus kandeliae TaxID=2073160 RepID=UPI000D3EAF32|nr:Lrp/AsnC ligand binding domain-containing protein [Acuticoccus kandeliae]